MAALVFWPMLPAVFLSNFMAKIKLLKIGELENGTIRLQSQLLVGQNVANFILEDGILKVWRYGNEGTEFYETEIPYEIVHNKLEMRCQPL